MKVITSGYNKHFIALSALFILGNGVIVSPPKNADEYNFLGFIIACFVAIIIYCVCFFVPVNRFTRVPICLLAFYCIWDAVISFIKFISDNLLPHTNRFLIVLPMILIILYIVWQRKEILLKFSFMSFFIVLTVIIFFFFATIKDFNIKNIFIYQLPTVRSIVGQMIPYIKMLILPIVLLSFFMKMNNIKRSASVVGVFIGFICFGLCILNSVLLFGIGLSGILDYPYSSAGSTVTFGTLFTRLDGFLYYFYLACCIVKCGVGIFTIKKLKERSFP